MPKSSVKYAFTRKQAADLLDISTRTLDRYIRSGKLSSRKKGGNILLNEQELNNFKVAKFQKMHGASPKAPGRVHRHVDSKEATPVQTIIDADTGEIEEKAVAAPAKALAKSEERTAREQVFEELYDLSRREIREYNNKLEAANYRLGKLEAQLKNSVPLIEYQEKNESLRAQENLVTTKVQRQKETIGLLQEEMKAERFNKNIYIGLVMGLLALQPLLWLLLQG